MYVPAFLYCLSWRAEYLMEVPSSGFKLVCSLRFLSELKCEPSPFPAPQFQRKLVPGTYHAIRSNPEPRGVDDVHNLGVGGIYALFRRDRVKHEA